MTSRTRTIAAWRVTPSGNCYPLDIGAPEDLQDALAGAQCGSGLQHKDTVLIHYRDDGLKTGRLFAYAVKQKSQPIWQKCPDTLVSKPFRPLYLAELFSAPVPHFAPERPFDAFLDPASGRDPSLVQAA